MVKRLIELGFELKKQWDEENQESYFDLFLEREKVGFTEMNPVNNKLEIICEERENYLKVIRLVGGEIIVWAWYEGTELTSYKDNKVIFGNN